MSEFQGKLHHHLVELARALIDQEKAHVLIPPNRDAPGYWFGGGNLVRDADGRFVLVGRYRDSGDSRTGLAAGPRGRELAVFRAESFLGPWEKVLALPKARVAPKPSEAPVLSIEGTSLLLREDGVELYVSSEKEEAYPREVRPYRKQGTGVWSIDVMAAPTVEGLAEAEPTGVLTSADPTTLHVKDPVVFEERDGAVSMIYCSHPYCWSSSNTGLAVRGYGGRSFEKVTEALLPRGNTWDVAAFRVTGAVPIPPVGLMRDAPAATLYFYDGAECLRSHDEGGQAVSRPRGYSCEELGGLAWGPADRYLCMERLSVISPLFISPWGTGCSRYVKALLCDDGIYAIWQQSREDRSQPLVGHLLPLEEVERLLTE